MSDSKQIPSPAASVSPEIDPRLALQELFAQAFSKLSFDSDPFIQAHLNDAKALPVEFVLEMPQVLQISRDWALIQDVLRSSKAILFTEDGLRPLVRPEQCTIILRDILSTSSDQVVGIFTQVVGCPSVLSVREDMNNTWFVTFGSEVDARLALELTKQINFEGKPLKARLKGESLSRPQTQAVPVYGDQFGSPVYAPVSPMGSPGMYFGGYLPSPAGPYMAVMHQYPPMYVPNMMVPPQMYYPPSLPSPTQNHYANSHSTGSHGGYAQNSYGGRQGPRGGRFNRSPRGAGYPYHQSRGPQLQEGSRNGTYQYSTQYPQPSYPPQAPPELNLLAEQQHHALPIDHQPVHVESSGVDQSPTASDPPVLATPAQTSPPSPVREIKARRQPRVGSAGQGVRVQSSGEDDREEKKRSTNVSSNAEPAAKIGDRERSLRKDGSRNKPANSSRSGDQELQAGGPARKDSNANTSTQRRTDGKRSGGGTNSGSSALKGAVAVENQPAEFNLEMDFPVLITSPDAVGKDLGVKNSVFGYAAALTRDFPLQAKLSVPLVQPVVGEDTSSTPEPIIEPPEELVVDIRFTAHSTLSAVESQSPPPPIPADVVDLDSSDTLLEPFPDQITFGAFVAPVATADEVPLQFGAAVDTESSVVANPTGGPWAKKSFLDVVRDKRK